MKKYFGADLIWLFTASVIIGYALAACVNYGTW